MNKNNEDLNNKLYYFLTFLNLSNSWGRHLKEYNFFKQNDKMLFNNSLNAIESMVKMVDKKIPEDLSEEMMEVGCLFNDVFDKLAKETDSEKREAIILLLKKIAEDKLVVEKV